jgi:hypothetical protein
MGNIRRIKDAAAAIAERGPPPRNRRGFRWKQNMSDSPASGWVPLPDLLDFTPQAMSLP